MLLPFLPKDVVTDCAKEKFQRFQLDDHWNHVLLELHMGVVIGRNL